MIQTLKINRPIHLSAKGACRQTREGLHALREIMTAGGRDHIKIERTTPEGKTKCVILKIGTIRVAQRHPRPRKASNN